MNVYDFDGTIYNGDSTIDFYFYCLYHHPLLIRYVPRQIWGIVLYKVGKIDKTKMKSQFFSFLRQVRNRDALIRKFWEKNIRKIEDWYFEQQKEDDVLISASPEFLLQPVCDRLGINTLIASQVVPDTGKFLGKNCYGEEKILRFRKTCGAEAKIDNFYSDSLSDSPMACIAQNAFLCKRGERKKWEI